jgi:hypothetical protein
MCTRPDRTSIPHSAAVVALNVSALAIAIVTLIVAIVTVPARLARRTANVFRRPAAIRHIGVQVLVDDRGCVAELTRTIDRTLQQPAQTWSPLTLPIDRGRFRGRAATEQPGARAYLVLSARGSSL